MVQIVLPGTLDAGEMNASEIHSLVREQELENVFCGVYPRTDLPLAVMESGQFLVLNTQGENQPGSHWQLLCKPSECSYELFDSLGTSRAYVQGILPSTVTTRQIEFTDKPVQRSDSETCALFTIYFMVYSFENLVKNESDVVAFFQSSPTWQKYLRRKATTKLRQSDT